MKYLVTGATGLVGSNLVKTLIDKFPGHTVFALARNEEKLDELATLGAKTIKFDLSSDFESFSLLDKIGSENAIWFHCAAAISGASTDVLHDVNVVGTQKLSRKADQLGIQKIVLISTIATYKLVRKGNFTEEDPQFPDSEYGKSKLAQEGVIREGKTPFVIIRPPFIGGPQDENVFPELVNRINESKMYQIGDGKFGFVDARDLSEIAILLTSNQKAIGQSFNVQSNAIRWKDAIDYLGQKLGKEEPYTKKIPVFVARIIGLMADLKAKLTGRSNQRGISTYRVKTLIIERILDTTKLDNLLSFQYKYSFNSSLDEWLSLNKNY